MGHVPAADDVEFGRGAIPLGGQSSAPVEPLPYELGILFVHGIGSQKRGDTLVAFGGALAGWLDAWVAGASRQRTGDRGGASVSGTRLRRDDGGPARSLITAEAVRDDGSGLRHRWQMAESWWAEDFPAPGFVATAKWTFCVAPWVIQRHLNLRFIGGLSFVEGFHRDRRLVRYLMAVRVPPSSSNPVRSILTLLAPVAPFLVVLLRRALAVALASVLGVLAQLAMIGLLALSAVPYVRRLAMRGHRLVAQTVGDTYVLASQPLVLDAMVSRIQDDVAWLAERCDNVAVVAHSQGAALAHSALSDTGTADRVDLLVTFGAGIAKLRALTRLSVGRSGFAFTLRLVGLGLLVAGALLARAEPAAGAASIALAVVALAASVVLVPRFTDEQAPLLNVPRLGLGLRWIDFYASHDPVPEGRLSRQPPIGLSSRRVYNRRSTLTDHTSYWSNVEGFVHPLCRELAAAAGWTTFDGLTSEDERIVSSAERARVGRTELVSFGSLSFAVAGAATCLLAGGLLGRIGAGVLSAAISVSPFLGWGQGANQLADQGWAPTTAGVFATLAVFVCARNLTIGAFWRSWDRGAAAAMAARRGVPGTGIWGVRIALTALAGVALATGLAAGPESTALVVVGWVLTGLLGLAALTAWAPEEGAHAVDPTVLLLVDPNTGETSVAGRSERFRSGPPFGLATSGTEIWTACGPKGRVARTDAVTGNSMEIQLAGSPHAITLGPAGAWITTDDSLVKIDRKTGSVCWASRLEPGLAGLAVGAAAVWIASAGSVSVLRVSPVKGDLEAVVGLSGEPSGVAVSGRSVWVTGPRLGLLIEVDSLTNSVVREIDVKGVPFGTPILAREHWWMYDLAGGLIRVDPSDGSVRRFPHSDACIGGLTALDGRIWQADSWKGALREYADGDRLREIQVPGRPQEVAVVGGHLCVLTSVLS